MITPLPLKPGDTIGVMAPSSRIARADLDAGKSYLEERGYKVFIHPQCDETHHQSAGTHDQKLAALHDLAKDENIKGVIFAGGGNRSLHLLDHIDYGLLAANPKIYMGFSDNTALLNSIAARSRLVTYHGPVLKRLAITNQKDDILSLLEGKTNTISLDGASYLHAGNAEGVLIGGNLSLAFAMNEDDFPVRQNYILLLEDIGEELSHLDRMLCAMRRRGIFHRASAIIFGQFTDMKDTGTPFGFSFEDIVREHTNGLHIPALLNAPFGHEKMNNTALPIGARVQLQSTTLKILD